MSNRPHSNSVIDASLHSTANDLPPRPRSSFFSRPTFLLLPLPLPHLLLPLVLLLLLLLSTTATTATVHRPKDVCLATDSNDRTRELPPRNLLLDLRPPRASAKKKRNDHHLLHTIPPPPPTNQSTTITNHYMFTVIWYFTNFQRFFISTSVYLFFSLSLSHFFCIIFLVLNRFVVVSAGSFIRFEN